MKKISKSEYVKAKAPIATSLSAPASIAAAMLLGLTVAAAAPALASAQSAVLAGSMAPVTTSTTIISSSSTPATPSITWPAITAQSAFVYNPISGQVVYEKNADTQRPTASLLKIMTAATADNILAMSPTLANKKLAILNMKNEAAVDFALPTGSTWLPDPLTQIMLIGSSNKAAETIASQLIPRSSFLSLMNFYAKRMGLVKTYFRNASGLTEGPAAASTTMSTSGNLNVAGGVSTPREFAKMMWNIISEHPGLLDITGQESITITSPKTAANPKGQTVISNTNKILSNFPIIFGKTGFTENAGGNLAIVMQKSSTSQPYIIVVLDSSDTDARFVDAAKLASTTLQLMNLQEMQKEASAAISAPALSTSGR